MTESEIAKRDRLEYMIALMRNQIAALKSSNIATLAVGSGEISIQLDGDDVPPEVISGLEKMLEARIATYEKELAGG